MKALVLALLLAVAASVHAQPRLYSQAELDALLAPIALYPDPLLSQVLIAATYPDDVREAAAWSRANAHLKGDDAVRAADSMPWDASLKALLAYPDLLARMDESPQWTTDLGQAFLAQEPLVMETVQALRRRAQASGFLQSDGYQSVQAQDNYIVVQPVQSHVVYVPWYNPLVVYGPWWWHAHRPIAWRPWHPRPVSFISLHIHRPQVDWHHRHAKRHRQIHRPVHVHRPVQVHRPVDVHKGRVNIHNHVHQAQRARPIVQGAHIQPRIEHRRSEHKPVRIHRPAQIHDRVHHGQARQHHRANDRGNSHSRGQGQGRGRGNHRR